MPELLTQRKTPNASGGWPEIDRNPGRLQFGTPAGFASEYPAGFNRNPQGWSDGEAEIIGSVCA
jgi:hypothetical protein